MRIRLEIPALLLLLAFLVVLATLAHREDMNQAQLKPETIKRSTYSTFPEGYKALALALSDLGIHVQKQLQPYAMLPAHGTLIVADPYETEVTPYEARELMKWLRAGNHALVIVERHPGFLLELEGKKNPGNPFKELQSLDIPVENPFWQNDPWWQRAPKLETADTTTATALATTFLSRNAPSLAVSSTLRFPDRGSLPDGLTSAVGGVAPLYRDEHGVVVAYSAVGNGGIVWCCSPWSFSNRGIGKGNNLAFVLALAGLQPGAPVIFDEYHHGHGANMSLWSLAPLQTKLGVLQLALALVLLLVVLAWRFGPARPPADERFTRSRAEYLTAMAGLLERVQATHVVRDRLAHRLCRELGRRLLLPPGAPLESLPRANAARPVVDQHALERIIHQFAMLQSTPRPNADTLLRLANDIERLLHARKA